MATEKKKKAPAKKKATSTEASPVGRPRNLVKLTVTDVDKPLEDLLLGLSTRMGVSPERVVLFMLDHFKTLSRVHGQFGLVQLLERHRG
jgi:hypothetical protein